MQLESLELVQLIKMQCVQSVYYLSLIRQSAMTAQSQVCYEQNPGASQCGAWEMDVGEEGRVCVCVV